MGAQIRNRRWTNKKYGKRQFRGEYKYFRSNRIFELTEGNKIVTFESWQAAKELGWVIA